MRLDAFTRIAMDDVFGSDYKKLASADDCRKIRIPLSWPKLSMDCDDQLIGFVDGLWNKNSKFYHLSLEAEIKTVSADIRAITDPWSLSDIEPTNTIDLANLQTIISHESGQARALFLAFDQLDPSAEVKSIRSILLFGRALDKQEPWVIYRDLGLPPAGFWTDDGLVQATFGYYTPLLLAGAMFYRAFAVLASDISRDPLYGYSPLVTLTANQAEVLNAFSQTYRFNTQQPIYSPTTW